MTGERDMDEFIEVQMPELHSIDVRVYKDLLRKLERNEANVPLDTLKTVHRAPYDRLRKQLKEMTMAVVYEVAYRQVFIRREDERQMLGEINRIIASSGIAGQITRAVYERKSYEEVVAAVSRLGRMLREVTEGDGEYGQDKAREEAR